jgi:hypothetical protein
VTCANSVFSTYVYHADGLHGPTINKLSATTPIPSGATPISVYNGVVTCQESGENRFLQHDRDTEEH